MGNSTVKLDSPIVAEIVDDIDLENMKKSSSQLYQ